jgi:hypothetical protein
MARACWFGAFVGRPSVAIEQPLAPYHGGCLAPGVQLARFSRAPGDRGCRAPDALGLCAPAGIDRSAV